MLSSVNGVIGVSSRPPEAPAPPDDRRIRVLVLIPTLDVGGAEMDVVRTLPRIDRSRFHVTVCTFLARGELGRILQEQGIDVIGPLSASFYEFRQIARRIVQRILSLLWLPVIVRLRSLRQLLRRAVQRLSALLRALLGAMLLRRIAHRIRL